MMLRHQDNLQLNYSNILSTKIFLNLWISVPYVFTHLFSILINIFEWSDEMLNKVLKYFEIISLVFLKDSISYLLDQQNLNKLKFTPKYQIF